MKRPNIAAFGPSSRQFRKVLHQTPFQHQRYHRQQGVASGLAPFHTTTNAGASLSSLSAPSSTKLMATSVEETWDSIASIITSPGGIFTSVVGVLSLMIYWRYQGAIRQRLKQVRDESWLFGAGVTMVRGGTADTETNLFRNLQLLQVNPDFQKANPEWNVVSLGDYLATLRPKQLPQNFSSKDLPKLVQQELEAGLTFGLLKALGPNLGRAVLPGVGLGPIQSQAQKLGSRLATRWIMSKHAPKRMDENDKAGLPISIMSVLALSENNAKLNSGSSSSPEDPSESSALDDKIPGANLSAMQKMKQGEASSGPTFDEKILPNEGFVLTQDFHATVRSLEQTMMKSGHCGDHSSTEMQTAQAEIKEDQMTEQTEDSDSSYNPNDKSLGPPTPVNPRLFPDLHLGYGDAKCSHTKRQVLQMRLISVILNRLASNYHRMTHDDSELFTMQLHPDGKIITKPTELVEGLIDMGHDITVVTTSRMTSFGIGMCIKEKDGSWSNVPLGVFLESGYEDSDGNMAPVMMPHSGLRLIIGDGPLTGNQADEYDDFDETAVSNPLIIQHFIGIEGFCGWKPDQNPEVPFNENVESGKPLKGETEVVRAVRLAGLYATVLNGLATDLQLPFGGYGVTAVCNDSAAIIQQCLYGESYIFPLTSIGRYMQRTLRYSQNLALQLQQTKNEQMKEEIQDLEALIEAMMTLPSDINSMPAEAPDAARRLLRTLQPQRPLALMNDSKMIMESILRENERNQKDENILTPPSLQTNGENRA